MLHFIIQMSFLNDWRQIMDYIATNAYWWNFLARNWHAWLLARISTLKSVENLKQSSKSIVSSTDILHFQLRKNNEMMIIDQQFHRSSIIRPVFKDVFFEETTSRQSYYIKECKPRFQHVIRLHCEIICVTPNLIKYCKL